MVVGGLGRPVVVDKRAGDGRSDVQQAVQGETAGGPVLADAQGLHLDPQQLGLVTPGGCRPRPGILVVGRWEATQQYVGFGPVHGGQALLVHVRPGGRVQRPVGQGRRFLGDRLGSERRHEPARTGHPVQVGGQVGTSSAVPAEPQMTVGVVQPGEVGKHPGVADYRP